MKCTEEKCNALGFELLSRSWAFQAKYAQFAGLSYPFMVQYRAPCSCESGRNMIDPLHYGCTSRPKSGCRCWLRNTSPVGSQSQNVPSLSCKEQQQRMLASIQIWIASLTWRGSKTPAEYCESICGSHQAHIMRRIISRVHEKEWRDKKYVKSTELP